MSKSVRIIINAGGVKYETFKSTLKISDYFIGKIDFKTHANSSKKTEENVIEEIFEDCDSEGFRHILNYLRFPLTYVIPMEYAYLGDYFLIPKTAYGERVFTIDPTNTVNQKILQIEELLESDFDPITKSYRLFSYLENIILIKPLHNIFKNAKFILHTIAFNALIMKQEDFNGYYNTICMAHRSNEIPDKFKHNYTRLDDMYHLDIETFRSDYTANYYKMFNCTRFNDDIKKYVIYFITMLKTHSDWHSIKKF
jgi:BTB/POZ domain